MKSIRNKLKYSLKVQKSKYTSNLKIITNNFTFKKIKTKMLSNDPISFSLENELIMNCVR